MLAKKEVGIMRHAVGFPDYNRNHYAAGYDDVALCEGLVNKGFMVRRAMHPEVCHDPLFQVTSEGYLFLEGEK